MDRLDCRQVGDRMGTIEIRESHQRVAAAPRNRWARRRGGSVGLSPGGALAVSIALLLLGGLNSPVQNGVPAASPASPFSIPGSTAVSPTAARTAGILPATGSPYVASIPFGGPVSGVAFNPLNGLVYVTNSEGGPYAGPLYNNVSVINGTALVVNIPVGGGPEGAAFNPFNGYVYVADAGSNSLSVINEDLSHRDGPRR
jgi:DNA-binding beta-propeller fold protein YncE